MTPAGRASAAELGFGPCVLGLDAPLDAAGFALVCTRAEAREIDRRAIEEDALPGRQLMELAGAGTARLIRERCGGRVGRAVVLCGAGNNGGDGYVVACHLADHGWAVRCVAGSDPGALTSDARTNHDRWVRRGGPLRVLRDAVGAGVGNWLGHADVVVDALFGTGLTRPIDGVARALIEVANGKGHGLKVALDIPSGVAADSGAILGTAFRADLTATYGVSKLGLHQYPGAACAGEVMVVGIGWPRPTVDAVGTSYRLATEQAVAALLPAVPRDGHKGRFGHVGVVGGRGGTPGAAVLAGWSALRAGSGLVTWNRDPAAATEVIQPPELMLHPGPGLDPRSTTLIVGPGLGTDDGAQSWLDLALASGRRLVLDADALNLLAAAGERGLERLKPLDAVLTPHPGEAARLLGVSTAEVQVDRPGAARALCERTGSVVVLKGAASLVAAPGVPTVTVPGGEPALAVAGSGDVLAGLIGALLAQGCGSRDAAVAGAAVHVAAGAEAGAGHGRRGALAREIADEIPQILDALRAGWLRGSPLA